MRPVRRREFLASAAVFLSGCATRSPSEFEQELGADYQVRELDEGLLIYGESEELEGAFRDVEGGLDGVENYDTVYLMGEDHRVRAYSGKKLRLYSEASRHDLTRKGEEIGNFTGFDEALEELE